MASPLRREKMGMLFREELSKIIDREIDFGDSAFVTVTKVMISDDSHYANVFVSLLGAAPADALALLKKNVYHIQQMLNRRVKMRPVPRIAFVLDHEEFKREVVEKKIAELKKNNEL